jgi:hypothetical protein
VNRFKEKQNHRELTLIDARRDRTAPPPHSPRLSNLGHRPLKLAGMTISLPKTLIRENLAERFGYDRHHA